MVPTYENLISFTFYIASGKFFNTMKHHYTLRKAKETSTISLNPRNLNSAP